MKNFPFFLCAVFLASLLNASVDAKEPHRPRIAGIDQVQLLVGDIAAAQDFYKKTTTDYCIDGASRFDSTPHEQTDKMPFTMTDRCTWIPNNTFFVNPLQKIGLSLAPGPLPTNAIESITFTTDNLPELRRYLVTHGVTPSKAQKPDTHLTFADPEGHVIAFAQRYNLSSPQATTSFPFPKIIHAGFIVHDREKMEHFYKDILGFRPYWHGGRTDDRDDWISLQVPDGSEWVEFMLNVPDNADKRTLGVANHIALGVNDIQAAKAQLIKNGLTLTEEPKIGRGGKWQLNVYDPDGTRIEFMEFTPVQKPCCSEYTAPHPKP